MIRAGFLLEGAGMLTRAILGEDRRVVKQLMLVWVAVWSLALCSGCAGQHSPEESGAISFDSDRQPSEIRFEGQATPVLLPRTNLYIFLTSSRPLYYRDGHYYQYWRDHWFMSDDLKGPWQKADIQDIPDLLRSVPPEYYYDNFPYKLQKER